MIRRDDALERQRPVASHIAFPADLLALTKPRLTAMVLATTAVGYYLASGRGPLSDPLHFLSVLAACALLGAGANGLNQCIEQDADARMRRTERRPLPAGRIAEGSALGFALVISGAGLIALARWTDPVTSALGAATLLSYVLIYTPAKRLTHLNTYIGAVPGALPVVMGWTAGGGSLGPSAAGLFLILFVWQVPHFYAIAWTYREDYERAGFRMITSLDADPRRLALRILCASILLTLVSLLPWVTGIAGRGYAHIALAAGALFCLQAASLVRGRMSGSRSFMLASILYLCALIVALIADPR